jgi:hypothetical protein
MGPWAESNCRPTVLTVTPLLAVHPDGTPAELPKVEVQREGEVRGSCRTAQA